MIGHLRGTIIGRTPNELIVDVGGVGYEISIPISTYTALTPDSDAVSLRIYTHVREDAIVLFGFATAEEKTVFERLISVSGIGPKLAVTVLSGLPTFDLINAIRGGDVQKLVRIPGVGKKTAERMVLELKDKLTASAEPQLTGQVVTSIEEPANVLERDVMSALLNLGCSRATAEEAIRKTRERGVLEEFEPFFRTAMSLVR